MADFIYLPDTHESQPEFVRVGDVCYELIGEIPRDEHKENYCWEDLSCKLEDATSCDECCWPSVLYVECCSCFGYDDLNPYEHFIGYCTPTMFCTITGNGVSGENKDVSWCGETWTPAEDGIIKNVCAANYNKQNTNYTLSSLWETVKRYRWSHIWFAGIDELKMHRGGSRQVVMRSYYSSPFTFSTRTSGNILSLKGREDRKIWFNGGNTWTADSDLNMILGVPRPTSNDYNLTSEFFGSYTINGITYTWTEGENWDKFGHGCMNHRIDR